MANVFSQVTRPLGLDPTQGYDTGAAGAKDAQKQANALSDLQWNRQQQGLQQAQGFTGQLQSLYNSIYSPGGGAPAAGGMQAMGGGAPGGSMLLGPPGPPTAPAGGSGGRGLWGTIADAPGQAAVRVGQSAWHGLQDEGRGAASIAHGNVLGGAEQIAKGTGKVIFSPVNALKSLW